MSRIKSVAAYNILKNQVNATNKQFISGLMNMNTKVIPCDYMDDDDSVHIFFNGKSYQKLCELHNLNRMLRSEYEDQQASNYQKFLEHGNMVVIAAFAAEISAHGFGVVKSLYTHGFEETKKRLVEKLTMADQLKVKKADEQLQEDIERLEKNLRKLESLFEKRK